MKGNETLKVFRRYKVRGHREKNPNNPGKTVFLFATNSVSPRGAAQTLRLQDMNQLRLNEEFGNELAAFV